MGTVRAKYLLACCMLHIIYLKMFPSWEASLSEKYAIPIVTHNITFSCREITKSTLKYASRTTYMVTELFWDAVVNCHLKFTATVS